MVLRRPGQKAVSIEGESARHLTLARGRIALIVAFFMVAYLFLAARAFDLAVIQGVGFDKGSSGGDASLYVEAGRKAGEGALRGDILDRNGVVLATTLPMVSLYVDPSLVIEPKVLARDLSHIVSDVPEAEFLEKLTRDSRFLWLKRNITPAQQAEVLALGQPGLGFEKSLARFYPHGSLAAHLVGYVSIDQEGLAGLERAMGDELEAGSPVTSALDIRLQHILHREIKSAMQSFSAKAGAGVILDAHSGEVLAGVSLPDFNPHEAGNEPGARLFNRLTLGVYELGSIFKIFSTAAYLERDDTHISDEFDATEPLRAGRFFINDYHAEDRILTVPEVFMYSSNIGSALMGQALGTDALRKFYADLGLLDALQFEIKEIGRPLVPSPWRDVTTLTASYGHGLATTPLQVASAVGVIANGGLKLQPTLLKKGHEDVTQQSSYSLHERIISSKTSHNMRALMRLVVSEGTGKNADVVGLQVGGKTGTAEKFSAKGGYDRKRLISSFVGIFPASDPKYVVMVMVDEPKGNKKSYGYATAGWVAAPAAARIISSMAAVLGIPAVETVQITAAPDTRPAYGDHLKQFISVKQEGR